MEVRALRNDSWDLCRYKSRKIKLYNKLLIVLVSSMVRFHQIDLHLMSPGVIQQVKIVLTATEAKLNTYF